MIWRNTDNSYGRLHIILHWLAAALIAMLLALGLWMTGLDYYDPWYRKGPDLHRSIGVLLGMLMLVRILWRLGNPIPAPLARSRWELKIARSAHLVLYLLPFSLIVSGYLISTADGRAVAVFDWFEIPATLQGIDGQEDVAGELHFALAMILLSVIVLHAGAALRHHLILKDDTLHRMIRPQTGHSRKGDTR